MSHSGMHAPETTLQVRPGPQSVSDWHPCSRQRKEPQTRSPSQSASVTHSAPTHTDAPDPSSRGLHARLGPHWSRVTQVTRWQSFDSQMFPSAHWASSVHPPSASASASASASPPPSVLLAVSPPASVDSSSSSSLQATKSAATNSQIQSVLILSSFVRLSEATHTPADPFRGAGVAGLEVEVCRWLSQVPMGRNPIAAPGPKEIHQ